MANIKYWLHRAREWENILYITTKEDGFYMTKYGSEDLQRLLSELSDFFCDPSSEDIAILIDSLEENTKRRAELKRWKR